MTSLNSNSNPSAERNPSFDGLKGPQHELSSLGKIVDQVFEIARHRGFTGVQLHDPVNLESNVPATEYLQRVAQFVCVHPDRLPYDAAVKAIYFAFSGKYSFLPTVEVSAIDFSELPKLLADRFDRALELQGKRIFIGQGAARELLLSTHTQAVEIKPQESEARMSWRSYRTALRYESSPDKPAHVRAAVSLIDAIYSAGIFKPELDIDKREATAHADSTSSRGTKMEQRQVMSMDLQLEQRPLLLMSRQMAFQLARRAHAAEVLKMNGQQLAERVRKALED